MKDVIFRGTGTALVTPFNADMSINFEKLSELVEHQIENGVNAIIACGTTSEAAAMTAEEHLDVIKFIINCTNKRIPVIAGTGSNDTKFCLELSLQAKELGADGLLLVTPYYNKTSQKGLIEHFSYIADNVQMPCILYNVPSRTALNILPETYAALADNEHIVAIKEANGNISALAKTMALCGDRLAVYSGEDEQVFPIMAMGGKGVISVFSNALPDTMSQITSYMLNGDTETAKQLYFEFVQLMGKDGFFMDVNPIPIKYAMNKMGMNVGPCRMPLTTMTSESESAMNAILESYNLI